MGTESVPDYGPRGISQVHQGGVGRLDAINRIGFILKQCLKGSNPPRQVR